MPGDFAPSSFIGTGMRIQRPDCCKPNDPGRANPGFHSLSHRGWRSPRSGMKTKSHTRESHTRNTHTRESRTRVIWDFKLWFGGRIWDLGFRTLVRGVGSGIPNFGSGGRIRDFKLWFGGSDPGLWGSDPPAAKSVKSENWRKSAVFEPCVRRMAGLHLGRLTWGRKCGSMRCHPTTARRPSHPGTETKRNQERKSE